MKMEKLNRSNKLSNEEKFNLSLLFFELLVLFRLLIAGITNEGGLGSSLIMSIVFVSTLVYTGARAEKYDEIRKNIKGE